MNDPRRIPRGEKVARIIRALMLGPMSWREIVALVDCESRALWSQIKREIELGGWRVQVSGHGNVEAYYWIDPEQPFAGDAP